MIYFDNAATTKPKDSVVNEIIKCLKVDWGNPSSIYKFGSNAKNIVNESRQSVAKFLGCNSNEIIFTSGACESNSLSICGFLKANDYNFITTTIEHKSIMDLYDSLLINKSKIPVDKYGFVDLVMLDNVLSTSEKRCLVSIQFANNEIGTIQNMSEISKIVHKYNGVLHTDATQIIPDRKVSIDGIDMLSFSGQKLGASKGIGVLYVRDEVKIQPIIYGSQEQSLRGGTENVPYISGLRVAINELIYETSEIRDYFIDRIMEEVHCCTLIGCKDNRLSNNVSIYFNGVESESLLLYLDLQNICVSSGSACNSNSIKPSYVLKEIGLSDIEARSVIRFSFNQNTKDEVDYVVQEIKNGVEILRKMNGGD